MANEAQTIKDKAQTTAVTPHLRGVSGTGPHGSEGMTWVSNRPIDQILEKIINQLVEFLAGPDHLPREQMCHSVASENGFAVAVSASR
jgi:hypothetical protein